MVAHLACHNTVTERRGTAALYMAKDGRTALDAGLLLDALADIFGVTYALCNDHDEVALAGLLCVADALDDVLFKSYFTSGTSVAIAPTAMPVLSAMSPQRLPMTSTTLQRS